MTYEEKSLRTARNTLHRLENSGILENNLSMEQITAIRIAEFALDELCKSKDVQPVKCCKMIPLEPDCRGYTDVFICTNCHQHIHLGFIRKEYSGSYCIECGAEVIDENSISERCSNYMDCDGSCFIDDTPCDCGGDIEKCKGR